MKKIYGANNSITSTINCKKRKRKRQGEKGRKREEGRKGMREGGRKKREKKRKLLIRRNLRGMCCTHLLQIHTELIRGEIHFKMIRQVKLDVDEGIHEAKLSIS